MPRSTLRLSLLLLFLCICTLTLAQEVIEINPDSLTEGETNDSSPDEQQKIAEDAAYLPQAEPYEVVKDRLIYDPLGGFSADSATDGQDVLSGFDNSIDATFGKPLTKSEMANAEASIEWNAPGACNLRRIKRAHRSPVRLDKRMNECGQAPFNENEADIATLSRQGEQSDGTVYGTYWSRLRQTNKNRMIAANENDGVIQRQNTFGLTHAKAKLLYDYDASLIGSSASDSTVASRSMSYLNYLRSGWFSRYILRRPDPSKLFQFEDITQALPTSDNVFKYSRTANDGKTLEQAFTGVAATLYGKKGRTDFSLQAWNRLQAIFEQSDGLRLSPEGAKSLAITFQEAFLRAQKKATKTGNFNFSGGDLFRALQELDRKGYTQPGTDVSALRILRNKLKPINKKPTTAAKVIQTFVDWMTDRPFSLSFPDDLQSGQAISREGQVVLKHIFEDFGLNDPTAVNRAIDNANHLYTLSMTPSEVLSRVVSDVLDPFLKHMNRHFDFGALPGDCVPAQNVQGLFIRMGRVYSQGIGSVDSLLRNVETFYQENGVEQSNVLFPALPGFGGYIALANSLETAALSADGARILLADMQTLLEDVKTRKLSAAEAAYKTLQSYKAAMDNGYRPEYLSISGWRNVFKDAIDRPRSEGRDIDPVSEIARVVLGLEAQTGFRVQRANNINVFRRIVSDLTSAYELSGDQSRALSKAMLSWGKNRSAVQIRDQVRSTLTRIAARGTRNINKMTPAELSRLREASEQRMNSDDR